MADTIIPDRFEVLEEISRTECEILLRARDKVLLREVVLKRPGPDLVAALRDKADLDRSLREARGLARLQHHGVVKLIDVIETREGPLLVIEPVAGESLAELLYREKKLPEERVRDLGLQLSAALEAVHAVGIVHRGLSSGNIVMRADGSACLTGFTFAKWTPCSQGAMPGTTFMYKPSAKDMQKPLAIALPPHPAPEQILGQSADARSDIFGLGWVLYECLTGEPPYPQELDVEHWRLPRDLASKANGAPRELCDTILKCLSTSPMKRYASAAELRAALKPIGVKVAHSGGAPVARKKLVKIAAAAGVLVVGAVGAWVWSRAGTGFGTAHGSESNESLRGLAVAPKTVASVKLNGSVYDNLWAVVIGINAYQNWPKLSYAVADARSVKNVLTTKFGFPEAHVTELMDGDATLTKIRSVLGGEMRMKCKAGDGLFVFFAGHGQTIDLPNGGNMGYLVPVDGSDKEKEYFATLLPMEEIKSVGNMIPAKHLFFAVDACYSGLLASTPRGLSDETKLFVAQQANLRSRHILTAGGRGETVSERAEWGHSAFTYKLLEGLEAGTADIDGDGVFTSSEIGEYIKSRVAKLPGVLQNPQFGNLTGDEGEFIFIPRESPPWIPPDATGPAPK